jgi:hypothetical protein
MPMAQVFPEFPEISRRVGNSDADGIWLFGQFLLFPAQKNGVVRRANSRAMSALAHRAHPVRVE